MLSSDDVMNETLKVLRILEKADFRRRRPHIRPVETDDLENLSSFGECSGSVFINSQVETNYLQNASALSPADLRLGEFSCSVFANSQVEMTSDSGLDTDAVLRPDNIEFQKAVEENKMILQMYQYCHEEITKFQDPEELSFIMNYFEDIMCPDKVNKTVEEMQSVVDHIKTIAAEGNKLKQVLRSNVLNDVWKVKKEYHKSVINFFKMASELVKDMELFIVSLERAKSHDPQKPKDLLEKERKFATMLYEYTDTLADFRNSVKHSTK